MPAFSKPEKVELAFIVVVPVFVVAFVPAPGLKLELGSFVTLGALLLLVQGFFRDLWLLREARRNPAPAPAREAQCMCVESALGLTGVVAGIGLVGFGLTKTIAIGATGLAIGVAATMIAGFLLKDFVFEWSPWKIYREKNHAQVILRWRKKSADSER